VFRFAADAVELLDDETFEEEATDLYSFGLPLLLIFGTNEQHLAMPPRLKSNHQRQQSRI
jgi:hypothetical protein